MNKILGLILALILLTSCSSKQIFNDRGSNLPLRKSDYAIPLTIVNPFYPLSAARSGIEGWVLFEFDINEAGKPVDLVVLDSHPSDEFVENATIAIKQWTFEAKESNDNVRKRYTMEFKLVE